MYEKVFLERAKAVAAAVYSVLVVLAGVALPDPYNKWVALAVLVLGPIVVHEVENRKPSDNQSSQGLASKETGI